jgi:hypothetical protein
VAAGASFFGREIDGGVVARCDGRATWAAGRYTVGLDVVVDALAHDSGVDADLEIGPRWDVPWGPDLRVSLYARYLRSRHPLSLGVTGILAGFEVVQGERPSAGPPEDRPAIADGRISGALEAGASLAGRPLGGLRMKVFTPPIGSTIRMTLDVDGAAVTADDTGDLYWRYAAGVEATRGRLVIGGWYYHRSNHRLGEPNDVVTSQDVVEGGLETASWDRAVDGKVGRWGLLDGRARVGWIRDGSFGDGVGWNARGGIRWAAPVGVRARPYLAAEAEEGDVRNRAYSAGVLLPRGFDVLVGWRSDDQAFRADDAGWIATVTARF